MGKWPSLLLVFQQPVILMQMSLFFINPGSGKVLRAYDGIETLRALDRDEALNPLEART